MCRIASGSTSRSPSGASLLLKLSFKKFSKILGKLTYKTFGQIKRFRSKFIHFWDWSVLWTQSPTNATRWKEESIPMIFEIFPLKIETEVTNLEDTSIGFHEARELMSNLWIKITHGQNFQRNLWRKSLWLVRGKPMRKSKSELLKDQSGNEKI